MSESKADELRRLAPWTTIECDMCGSMHQATRSGGRVVAADTLLLCAGCEGHEQGRAAGDAAGYARGANRTARAMVAALYWRAGEAEARAHRYRTHEAAWDYYNSEAMFLRSAAQAMGLHL